jgi:hypothetical protein
LIVISRNKAALLPCAKKLIEKYGPCSGKIMENSEI